MSKKVMLCILDGFGESKDTKYNAILNAKAPTIRSLDNDAPKCLLDASGEFVGLPDGQFGNSEVGHLTIGAGRTIYQDLSKINRAFADHSIDGYPEIKHLIDYCLKNNKPLHIIGIISHGGVHGHINHVIGLCKILKKRGVRFYLHGISDGRDSAPQVINSDLALLAQHDIKLSTLCGRFYAMDRDKRYERTESAYNAIVKGLGAELHEHYVEGQYNLGTMDEFIVPAVSEDYPGMQDNDAVICTNFRADRARQTMSAILDKEFNGFETSSIKIGYAAIFAAYSERLAELAHVVFKKDKIQNSLAECLSMRGKSQLRVAETEKYAHVTYFFNCGKEEPYPLEERILVPSPKVKTYDETPDMSAFQIVAKIEEAVSEKKYDLIVINFANPDMVGHTGNYQAVVQAIEYIDKCLDSLISFARRNDYEMLITSDHGNAEVMFDERTNQPLTSHTNNPVPFYYIGSSDIKLRHGSLKDIAPTILDLMEIKVPAEMDGNSLIIK